MSTVSKLRSRLGGMGFSKSKQTSSPPTTANGTSPTPAASQPSVKEAPEKSVKGIDYSVGARNYTLKPSLKKLYPPIEPFKTGNLKVDDRHEVYWEACGNEKGEPVVFLHGGPGGGCSADDRRWFDPSHYCIYLFDQRGAGRSTPHADLIDNTTWDIVADIEKLRAHFSVEKWHLFGGSWGSCLSLAYAQTHPDRVKSMVLRGIFTLRRSELLFFYQDGSSHIFPDMFEPYREFIPEEERDDLMAAYYKRLTGDDEKVRLQAATLWSRWETATSKLYVDAEHLAKADDSEFALAFARIEAHFFVNRGWMTDGQLLFKENIDKIRHIPTSVTQGRYDVVCPFQTAYDLYKQWPEIDFNVIPDSGHASRDPGTVHKLMQATDKMRSVK